MAPEYLVRGQLTEKADVYSFGVLVLEILCGRRNNVFREDSGSLLQTVSSFSATYIKPFVSLKNFKNIMHFGLRLGSSIKQTDCMKLWIHA